MRRMASVKTMDYTIDLDKSTSALESSVKYLVSLVVDSWAQENMNAEVLSGGFVNTVYKVWCKDDTDEAVIVRVYTQRAAVFVEKETHLAVMRAAADAGCGSQILAIFTNGLIYKYFPGEPINPQKYDTPEIRRLVAGEIAKLHHIQIPTELLSKDVRIFRDIDRMFQGFPELGVGKWKISDMPCLSSTSAFKAEIEWLKAETLKVKTDVVISNGDVWWANVIYDKKTESIGLIDYDFSGYNFIPSDLSRFLGFGRADLTTLKIGTYTEEEQKDFIRFYLEKRIELMGRSVKVDCNMVNKLFSQCQLHILFIQGVFIGLALRVATIAQNDVLIEIIMHCGQAYSERREEYFEFMKSNVIEDFTLNV